MKILMIGPFPDPITGQTIANEMILNGLRANGHHVDFIDSDTDKKFSKLSSQGKFDIKKVIKSLSPISKGVKGIIFNKYDVVYITPAQSYIGFMKYVPFISTAKMLKVPCYIHFHGGFVRKMYDELSKEKQQKIANYFNMCNGVIVLGESLRTMLDGIVPSDKVFVCENGVQPEFVITENELKEKEQKAKENKTANIIYLSNLMKTKGIIELLEACVKLKEDGYDFHIDVAGSIENDIEPEVKDYFAKLEDKLTYHGIVKGNKKRELLLKAEIFALPTFYPNEGQPISILEAMTMGGAVITTYQGGIGDIFEGEKNGVACKPQDSDNLKNAIIQCKRDLEKFIEYNYKNSIEKYSCESFVNRLYSIISRK